MAGMNVDGLVSGLDTSTIISQLMQLERQPQLRLKAKVDTVNKFVSAYQTINTRLAALKDAAAALSTATGWGLKSAASSNATSATVTATSQAAAGTLSFTVDRLASTHSLVSLGSVTAASDIVATAGSNIFLAQAGALGFASLRSSAGMAAGSHDVVVTQASAGASQTGSALGSSVTIAAGAQLEVALDGSTTTTNTIQLTAGTYSRQQLADMVSTASGGLVSASVTPSGELKLSTAREGSEARLSVTSANAALGFSAATASSAGTDGIVTVDGVATTITDTSDTGVQLNADAGGTTSLTASFSGGLRLGTVTGQNVSVGDGTLSSVVSAINTADAGMTANVFKAATGVYKLQVTSTTSGAAGALSLDAAPFSASLGIFDALAVASDAQLTVGGARVTSDVNTFSDLVPGVTLKALKADADEPVTVTISHDSAGLADKVGQLVEAVNGTLSYIAEQSRYDATTKKGGLLVGDSTARRVDSEIHATVFALFAGTSLSDAGITVNRDGTLAYDRDAFIAAYDADPAAMAAFFHDGGTAVDTADDGLGKRLETMAKGMTNTVTGSITTAIDGRKSEITSLQRLVDNWDVRLERREAALRKQFSGLEVALSGLKSQSSWLAGQLASLPSSSSS